MSAAAIDANVAAIAAATSLSPEVAIVLGSGLGGFVAGLAEAAALSYGALKGFPSPGVSGHGGELVVGRLGAVPVAVLSGRAHYYEYGDPAAMRPALETLQALGIKVLVLTNSAGSLRREVPPGAVMRITDHINFSGSNPLIGEASDARFVGLTGAYDAELGRLARKAAGAEGLPLAEGVYMWFSGPSFETPAEINAARVLGADAVGMSTVPEVILGRFLGMRIAAFSVITNYAAGMTGAELSHQETKDMAPEGGAKLRHILTRMLTDGAA